MVNFSTMATLVIASTAKARRALDLNEALGPKASLSHQRQDCFTQNVHCGGPMFYDKAFQSGAEIAPPKIHRDTREANKALTARCWSEQLDVEGECQGSFYNFVSHRLNMSAIDQDAGRQLFRVGPLEIQRRPGYDPWYNTILSIRTYADENADAAPAGETKSYYWVDPGGVVGYNGMRSITKIPEGRRQEQVALALQDLLHIHDWPWGLDWEPQAKSLINYASVDCIRMHWYAERYPNTQTGCDKEAKEIYLDRHILRASMPLFKRKDKIVNHDHGDGSQSIASLESVSHYTAEDGCYVACHRPQNALAGQVRVQGLYFDGGICVPESTWIGDDISQNPKLKALCRNTFAVCLDDACWVGGQTGGWLGLY